MTWPREKLGGLPEQFWQRALLFSLASNAALLFTCFFGLYLWPERLAVNSQNVFWLASGVNIGGLLVLGLRYWPVLLFNAFPVAWLVGEPMEVCILGASANTGEALVGAWIILKAGRFAGRFDTLRSVGSLLVASLLAPLVNTLLIPAYLCVTGQYEWSDYPLALGNWNLANGSAILFITPLLVSMANGEGALSTLATRRRGEGIITVMVTGALAFLAFRALFTGKGMNLAFLTFPPILYAAVRLGSGETAVVLHAVLLSIYAALMAYGRQLPVEKMPAILWFTQAIAWVLAATGYLVAALGAERRAAERRSLEASLAAEQARLSALRYQINPHFLFNALNSVRATLPLRERTAREMITSLSGYLRSTLDGAGEAQCPLRDELEGVRKYLHIEQHRFGSDLVVHFDIMPDAECVIIPSFVLQPLVENSIHHGLEQNPGPCEITISARCLEGRLHLSVSNSGPWRAPGSSSGTGTGLQNLKHRLHLRYGADATLDIDKLPTLVKIRMILPLV